MGALGGMGDLLPYIIGVYLLGGVLWASWMWVLEFNESLLDVVGHGEVSVPCVVAPFEVYAAKKGTPQSIKIS